LGEESKEKSEKCGNEADVRQYDLLCELQERNNIVKILQTVPAVCNAMRNSTSLSEHFKNPF
jgi:hypothetical protein